MPKNILTKNCALCIMTNRSPSDIMKYLGLMAYIVLIIAESYSKIYQSKTRIGLFSWLEKGINR